MANQLKGSTEPQQTSGKAVFDQLADQMRDLGTQQADALNQILIDAVQARLFAGINQAVAACLFTSISQYRQGFGAVGSGGGLGSGNYSYLESADDL